MAKKQQPEEKQLHPKSRRAILLGTNEEVIVYRHQPTGEWVDEKDFKTSYKAEQLSFKDGK